MSSNLSDRMKRKLEESSNLSCREFNDDWKDRYMFVLEIIDLKCNSVLKSKFAELPVLPSADDMIAFWRILPANEFEHLRSFAQRYICRFGSTYRCEQSFSAMKLIKNKNRARLTDSNLNVLMILATTNLQPDIDKLASNLQSHKSH